MARIQTRKILEASVDSVACWAEAAADKQSATALRSGSGGFLIHKDLSLDTLPPTNGILELAWLLDGL